MTFTHLDSLEGQSPSWYPFPLLVVKRVPWTEGTVESMALGDMKKLGSTMPFPTCCLLFQPHFHCTSSGFQRSPKSDPSSISSPPLLFRNVTVFTSLPTSLHFFSASGIVLGLGRIRWEDLVPGPQEGGGLEGGFLWAICFIALPHSLTVWGIPQLGGQDVTFPP